MKLETLPFKWAITEQFRDYLIGGTFTVYTDNNPLTYFHKKAKLSLLSKGGPPRFHRLTLSLNIAPDVVMGTRMGYRDSTMQNTTLSCLIRRQLVWYHLTYESRRESSSPPRSPGRNGNYDIAWHLKCRHDKTAEKRRRDRSVATLSQFRKTTHNAREDC